MKNLLFTLGIISPFTLFAQSIFIHEIDSDSPGLDSADFIELSSSTPSFNLDGYVLVLFNGGDDASYASYDLDGHTTTVTVILLLEILALQGPQLHYSLLDFKMVQMRWLYIRQTNRIFQQIHR